MSARQPSSFSTQIPPAPSRIPREGETGGIRSALLAQAAALRAQADSLEALARAPVPGPAPVDSREWLTAEEAAIRYRVGASKLYLLAREGRVTKSRLGRRTVFHAESIDRCLRAAAQARP